ncbi:MAG: hypothetical protein SGARI_003706 [Bacillariaceae sp.]
MAPTKGEEGPPKGSSFSLFVKLLVFVALAVALLLLTDVLEFEKVVGGFSSSSSSGGAKVEPAPFADGIVQVKTAEVEKVEEVVTEKVEKKETDPPKEKATPPPTDAPKTPPPTEAPKPTEKPVEKPKETEKPVAKDDKKKEEDKKEEAPPPPPAVVISHTPSLGAGNPTRHTYTRRGQPMSDEDRKAMVDKWGSWNLVDDKKRPQDDFYAAYPNRDVPRDKFPKNAWQTDTDYLAKFVPEGLSMVNRAYNAILEEYGLSEDDLKFFALEKNDDDFTIGKGTECMKAGGCTTKKSWENLKRRLLHAVMTEDSFVFAMGGHSSAAGVSNIIIVLVGLLS